MIRSCEGCKGQEVLGHGMTPPQQSPAMCSSLECACFINSPSTLLVMQMTFGKDRVEQRVAAWHVSIRMRRWAYLSEGIMGAGGVTREREMGCSAPPALVVLVGARKQHAQDMGILASQTQS